MTDFLTDPPRWKDRRDQANLAERAAGNVVRLLEGEPPLCAAQIARIAAGVRDPRPRRRRLWIPIAAAFALTAATATAAHVGILPRSLVNWIRPTSNDHSVRPASPRSSKPGAVRSSPAVPAPALLPARTEEPIPTPPPVMPAPVVYPPAATTPIEAKPRKVVALRPSTAPSMLVAHPVDAPRELAPVVNMEKAEAEIAPPAPSERARIVPPVAENKPSVAFQGTSRMNAQGEAAKVLGDVVRMLRTEGQPATALALLDWEAALLLSGHFSHEALLLRVESLLALRREADVLRLLDATSLGNQAASRSLLITRGTLRANANRCPEAMADFDRAAALSKQPDRQLELARARCEAHVP